MATSYDNLIVSPSGTKLWILNLGFLEADEAWLKRGANISTRSNPNPANDRRELMMYGVLIEHPKEGLILWETGAGRDYPTVAGAPINDIFAQINYSPDHELKSQIEKTGHTMADIKMVIMGHLHLDHSGGLEEFKGTETPILVHELELKNAFYSVATKSDIGVYLPHYLTFELNWQTWRGDDFEVAQGLLLKHMPGHTPGLSILQINLPGSGTWIATSDMYLVKDNYEDNHAQGFLSRDHDDWVASNQKIHQIARRTDAKMLYGHCYETLKQYKFAPDSYN